MRTIAPLLIVIGLLAGCSTLPPAATAPAPTAPTPATAMAPPVSATATLAGTPTPLTHPPRRCYHQLAYDTQSDRVILFGGYSPERVAYRDTWAYRPGSNTWTDLQPAHAPEGHGPMAYDAQSDRMILYVSAVLDPAAAPYGIAPKGETWAYDGAANTWTKLDPAGVPVGLLGAGMAYDAESDRMILFGGFDVTKQAETFFDDTWAYDFDTNTWTKMAPKRRPPGRNFHVMTYHAGADRVLLWGGNQATFDLSLWAYDVNTDTWEDLGSQGAPLPLGYAAMVYDPPSQAIIIFGGATNAGLPTNSAWAYQYTSRRWEPLQAETVPKARAWHAMVYAAGINQVILFGGGPGRDYCTDETWVYDVAANAWTDVTTRP